MYKLGLLAAASSVAVTGAAQAESARPVSTGPMNWTGFYAGIDFGQARHYASTTDVNNYGGAPPFNYVTPWFDSTKKNFAYGGHVGFNWQYQYVVVGAEADLNEINASKTFAPALGPASAVICPTTCIASATNELKWLATIRGRIGITVDRFLIYGTAGQAWGRVANRWGFGDPTAGSFSDTQFHAESTRTAPIYGGGVEVAFNEHWTVRGEYLYVNLGTTSSTTNTPNPLSGGVPPFRTDFKNKVDIVRLGLSYKW